VLASTTTRTSSRAMEGVLDQGPDDDAVDVPIVPMTRRKMTSIWSPWRARPTIVGGAEQVVEAVMGGAVWVVEVMMGSTMTQCRAVEATRDGDGDGCWRRRGSFWRPLPMGASLRNLGARLKSEPGYVLPWRAHFETTTYFIG
jgi:hypothetical protein